MVDLIREIKIKKINFMIYFWFNGHSKQGCIFLIFLYRLYRPVEMSWIAIAPCIMISLFQMSVSQSVFIYVYLCPLIWQFYSSVYQLYSGRSVAWTLSIRRPVAVYSTPRINQERDRNLLVKLSWTWMSSGIFSLNRYKYVFFFDRDLINIFTHLCLPSVLFCSGR